MFGAMCVASTQINKFIGDSEYMLGKSITYVDFVAYDLLDSLRELSAETVGQYPSIVAFLDRIEVGRLESSLLTFRLFRQNFSTKLLLDCSS